MFIRGQIRNRLLDTREKWKQALDPYCSWEIHSPWVRHPSFTPWILRKVFWLKSLSCHTKRKPRLFCKLCASCSRDDKHELLQLSAPSNTLLCNCPGKLGTTKVRGDSLTCYSELLPLILIAWWKLDLHSAFILALSKTDRFFFSSKIIKGQKSIFWCGNLLPLTWNPAYVLFTD